MSRCNRLLRLASALLPAFERVPRLPTSPPVFWSRCQILHARIEKARSYGLHLAERKLRSELRALVGNVRQQLDTQHDQLHVCLNSVRSSGRWRQLLDDLIALEQEFGAVEFDLRHRTMAVTTEPIVFDDIDLGPFKMSLSWNHLPDDPETALDVIALEPNAASSSDEVTHPHVSGEKLCLGEGRQAFLRSLAEGRLFDFFLLVASILHTYNSGSPYVSLAQWRGVRCIDCDEYVDDSEETVCQNCACTVCDGCELVCPGCSEGHCSGCCERCSGCLEQYCRTCLSSDERCRPCHEESIHATASA